MTSGKSERRMRPWLRLPAGVRFRGFQPRGGGAEAGSLPNGLRQGCRSHGCRGHGCRGHGCRSHGCRGFTLLEVIIVMMLITVFLSVAAMNFASLDSEEVTRKPANELIRMSKQAVRASAVEGRPFIIQFDKTGFGVLGKEGAEGGHVPLPADTTVEILRWGEKEWQPAEGQGWMFGANGLCEAIRVRFTSPSGILEMGFNPLTGSPVDEKYVNP